MHVDCVFEGQSILTQSLHVHGKLGVSEQLAEELNFCLQNSRPMDEKSQSNQKFNLSSPPTTFFLLS